MFDIIYILLLTQDYSYGIQMSHISLIYNGIIQSDASFFIILYASYRAQSVDFTYSTSTWSEGNKDIIWYNILPLDRHYFKSN